MKSIIGGSTGSTANTLAPGQTFFWPLGCGQFTTSFTVESDGSLVANFAATVSMLRMYISANSLSTAAVTVTFRKNGANTALTFSIAPGTTGWMQDLVNSVGLVVDDSYTVQVSVAAGGTGTIEIERSIAVLDNDIPTDYAEVYSAGSNPSLSTNSTTVFGSFSGNLVNSTTINEANKRVEIRKAGTLSYYQLQVVSNARVTGTVFRVRINGANATQNFTVGGGLVGEFMDVINTDAVVDGDDFNYSIVTSTGGGALVWRTVGINKNGSSGFTLLSATVSTGVTRSASATPTFYSLLGTSLNSSLTEAHMQIPIDFDAQLTNFIMRVEANSYSGTGTVKLRVNSADSLLTFNIGAGLVGLFEDAVNAVDVTAGDLACYSVEGGTSGSINMMWTALSGTDESSPPPPSGDLLTLNLLGVGQ